MPPKPDVRRLLKKQQQDRNKVTKVTHPFAKYEPSGRLMCVVCNSHVKSEAVWQAHLGSQLHRDNIQKLKQLKQQQEQQQQLKRRAPSPTPILSTEQSENKRMRLDDQQDRLDIELSDQADSEDEEMGLPADFFDNQQEEADKEIPQEEEEVPETEQDTNSLPTGFFDDPQEEARVQGTIAPEEQAKADLEKDLEMFNEAMMDVTQESKQVQEEDDETFWEERHLDMTREQAKFDSRVEKLKQLRQTGQTQMQVDQEEYQDEDGIKTGLKTSVRQILKSKPVKQVSSMFDDDDDESDDESDDDWRA